MNEEKFPIPKTDNWIKEALLICPYNPEGILYSEHGIAYSHETLDFIWRVFRRKKRKLSPEFLSKYVDVVTCAFTDYLATTENIKPHQINREMCNKMNATSIANFAYISLHAKKDEHRKRFAELLTRISTM